MFCTCRVTECFGLLSSDCRFVFAPRCTRSRIVFPPRVRYRRNDAKMSDSIAGSSILLYPESPVHILSDRSFRTAFEIDYHKSTRHSKCLAYWLLCSASGAPAIRHIDYDDRAARNLTRFFFLFGLLMMLCKFVRKCFMQSSYKQSNSGRQQYEYLYSGRRFAVCGAFCTRGY